MQFNSVFFPGTLGSHLWLDDTILDLLYMQMVVRPETPSVVGSIAQLLAVIRQIVLIMRVDGEKSAVVARLVTALVSWEPLIDGTRCAESFIGYTTEHHAALSCKKSVLLTRHWSATLEQCAVVVAEHVAVSRQGMAQLLSGIKAMLSHAVEVRLLSKVDIPSDTVSDVVLIDCISIDGGKHFRSVESDGKVDGQDCG
jgi:hypothetical protein